MVAPTMITVKTGFGEYTFTGCQLSKEGEALIVKRDGVPLLWASWPWTVVFT